MASRLKRAIQEEEDSLRIYQLCEGCQKRVEVYGIGTITEDEDVIVI